MERKDILIFSLFFIFWVFFLLFKKSKKSKENQKTPEKKGFTLKVLEFIAELKEAGEKERNDIESRMNAQVPVEPQTEPLTVKKKKAVASPAAIQFTRELHAKSTAPPIVKMQAPSAIASRKKAIKKRFPKQKMRDAIVWAEILGTPVGLRDN